MTGINPIGPGIPNAPAPNRRVAEAPEDEAVVAGGPTAEGIVIDRDPGARLGLMTGGLGVVGAGFVALGASTLPKQALANAVGGTKVLRIGGAGGIVAGALVAGVGMTMGAERIRFTTMVDGTRADAHAAATKLGTDVGIVRTGKEQWGLIRLDELKVAGALDRGGPGSIDAGAEQPFDTFVSKLGDVYEPDGEGWKNLGAVNRVDVSKLAASDAASIAGSQIGSPDGATRLRLGEPLDGGAVYPTAADAIRDRFEANASNIAFVQFQDGVVAFPIEGGPATTELASRGLQVEPPAAVQVLDADGVLGPGAPGEVFARGDMPIDDVSAVNTADAGTLVGRRIGSGDTRVGAVLGTWPSREQAGAALFERGEDSSVLVQLADGVVAYDIPKPFDGFQTMLGGAERITQLDATHMTRPGPAGAAQDAGRLPRLDVGGVAVQDAGTLVGRRIGEGGVRLGAIVGTYANTADATRDQYERGANHRVVVQLADGAAAYEVAPFEDFETLLGPDASVTGLHGSKLSHPTNDGVSATDAGRVKVLDLSTVSRSDANSLVGRRFAMEGDRVVRVTGVRSVHGSVADAWREASRGGANYVVKLADGAAIVNLDGSGDRLETGLYDRERLSRVDGAKAYRPSGDGWTFGERSVPFRANEPIGSSISTHGVSGTIRRHLGSSETRSGVISRIDDLSNDEYVVIKADGPDGTYHAYEIGGSGGRSWDEQLGDVYGVSEPRFSRNTYTREGGSVGNETVYDVTETRSYRTFTTDTGTETIADSGVRRSESIDSSATSALRRRRAEAREEARRRAEQEAAEAAERAARDAAERARREAEERSRPQAPSGGSSGGSGGSSGGSGYSGGSSGNSRPGSGGGYDSSSTGAGSDW